MHLSVAPGALLTEVRVPPPAHGRRLATYRKVRRRDAIDFPQLGLAVVLEATEVVTSIAAVLGALLPEPRVVKGLEAALGTRLEDDVIEALVAQTAKQAHAQVSIHGSPEWRKEVAGVEMRRALREVRAAL
jgi:CO/xanthine dehydrogenase FAD-binding subunit